MSKVSMGDTKKILVTVRTQSATYFGNIYVPAIRKRVSDLLNDEAKMFINLTDVSINGGSEKISFISINKNLIESIIE
ncbi:MAG: hypothetical protein HY036_09750 [Nitrospirae bacterium]|nr:hypothetical protein [Nitrospirota bacterium]MBI3352848.1 hypothetical protein [Nitrospirota bacterium]